MAVGTLALLGFVFMLLTGTECDRADCGAVGNYLWDSEWAAWIPIVGALLAGFLSARYFIRAR